MESSNSVFISYRREVSWPLADQVYQALNAHNISAFMDRKNMTAGKFDEQILREISQRPYFLPILQPGTLDRCIDRDDWLRREIAEAVRCERIIVPLYSTN